MLLERVDNWFKVFELNKQFFSYNSKGSIFYDKWFKVNHCFFIRSIYDNLMH
jgi:hypothetical protein